jgi:hypothetical protein
MIIKEIDMASVISSLTVTVKVSKTTRVRMWLGTRAMGLAARIFGCKVDIVTAGDEPTRDENGMLYIHDMPGQRARARGGMVKPGCYVVGEGRLEVFEPRA